MQNFAQLNKVYSGKERYLGKQETMLPTMSTFSHMQLHTCHKIHLSTHWNTCTKSTSIHGGIAHIEQTDAQVHFLRNGSHGCTPVHRFMTGLPNQSKTTNYFCWISTRVVAYSRSATHSSYQMFPNLSLIPFPMAGNKSHHTHHSPKSHKTR